MRIRLAWVLVGVLVWVLEAAFASSPARAETYVAFCPDGITEDAFFDNAHPVCRNIDVQLFTPPAALGATFTIAQTVVPRHMTFHLGIEGSHARSLMRVRESGDADGDGAPAETGNVVRSLTQVDVLAALGLFEIMELGVALPVARVRVANEPYARVASGSDAQYGLGDMRIGLKVPILRGGFGLAGKLEVTLPTGGDDRFLGAGYWTLAPGVLAGSRYGAVEVVAETTYHFRRTTVLASPDSNHPEFGFSQGDELEGALGMSYDVLPSLSAITEIRGRWGLRVDPVRGPVEVDAGLRWRVAGGFVAEIGVGTGLVADVGAPRLRVFGGVRYASERVPCVDGPEDYDGFQDGDYCADSDNDGDGVSDAADACPNDAEDRDGFEDGDGCPDDDDDGDGIRDAADRCPRETEDIDGFEDLDGCPDSDNDGDGFPDGSDVCPMEPEDRDDFQDEDGCPEPGPDAATVTVAGSRIMVSQRVYFDFDQDTIRSVSLPLLDQVAGVIQQLARERRVRVDGYSDDQGTHEYNIDLSYRRARAVVQYLITRSVPEDRLEYRGYGDEHAVAPNDTEEGRALNRRVEFTILEATDAASAPSRRRPHR